MKRFIAGLLLSACLTTARGQVEEAVIVDGASARTYVLNCRKPNGAFGPIDQDYTDAAWNFPAVATLRLLGATIDRPQAILEHGLGFPTGHVGYGHWQFFHQHRIRQLLGEPIMAKNRRIRLVHQGYEVRYYGSPFGIGGDTFFKAGGGPDPDPRDVAADEMGFYNLSSLHYLLTGLKASGREAANSDELIEWVRKRQAPGGGFVDVREENRLPADDEAHVAHTFQAVSILRILGGEMPDPESCVQFVRDCQSDSGGFRWHPDQNHSGNFADVSYTRAAVRVLDFLGAKPSNEAACIEWINSLQNADGGFGDQPGWRSRLYSTFRAVDALATLTGGHPEQAIIRKERAPARTKPIPEDQFQIFQALFKIPVIEEGDLVGLHQRGFNLLALKSDDFAIAASLRDAIRAKNLPMEVVLCPEAYSHRARISGGALLHHVANPVLNPAWTPAERAIWKTANTAGAHGLDWPTYQERVISPLQQIGSRVYPEQDFEMEHAFRTYDAGLSGGPGYHAILTGFNWAPRDFVRVFPWRERYVDRLTPTADVDAHGDLEKWSPQLDHCRNLFIAKGPSYEDFLEAASNGRVVCVIRIPGKNGPPATLYGPENARQFAMERMEEWKWWE
ncbi:MAG: hypothetical protein HKN23_09595 [Verrucomicrobiales bacterium]|nr:hypothetical protein [Verrucomicrobiales bacterium]